MKRGVWLGLWTAVLASLGGFASAEQVKLSQIKPSQGKPPAVASSSTPTPHTPLRGRTGASEPPELAGIMVKQNEARAKLGLPLLTWSEELAETTRAEIGKVTSKTCTLSSARKAKGADGMNLFWAGGIRSLTSATRSQDITPALVVSDWAAGRSSWDAATKTCRRTAAGASACGDYARMTQPAARTVGCVRILCPSQGQIWACSYGPAKP